MCPSPQARPCSSRLAIVLHKPPLCKGRVAKRQDLHRVGTGGLPAGRVTKVCDANLGSDNHTRVVIHSPHAASLLDGPLSLLQWEKGDHEVVDEVSEIV